MDKSEAVKKMENTDFAEKADKNDYIYIYKKIFILMMSSNTQKTITKKKKEKVREISKQYYKANKERLQKINRY